MKIVAALACAILLGSLVYLGGTVNAQNPSSAHLWTRPRVRA